MTEGIRNPYVQMLCTLASHDESTLQFPVDGSIFGFHAQQSCEKLFKALLSSHNRKVDRTHSMRQLLVELQDCKEQLPDVPFDIVALEPFAVLLRYEEGPELTSDDRTSIRETIAIIRVYVMHRIETIEGSR